MRSVHFLCRVTALVALLFTSGCVVFEPPKQQPPVPQPQAKKSYWHGDGVAGDPSILIDLGEQRAHFFKGKTEVGQAVISSGKKGFETPRGSYKVIERDLKHVSNLYGDFVDEAGTVVQRNVSAKKHTAPEGASFRGAKMPYFLRFHGATGMHAGVVPNFRASHGCVRLPGFMAKHFFENSPLGTPVRVTGGTGTGASGSAEKKKAGKPAKASAKPPKAPAEPAKAPAEPAETPAKPAEATPPAPTPADAKKLEAEPVKKSEPADAPAAPPGA